jgi:hypothetical protein
VRKKAVAAFAVLLAVILGTPVALASTSLPQIGHCVDVGPVYVLGQLVIDTYEICVPV